VIGAEAVLNCSRCGTALNVDKTALAQNCEREDEEDQVYGLVLGAGLLSLVDTINGHPCVFCQSGTHEEHAASKCRWSCVGRMQISHREALLAAAVRIQKAIEVEGDSWFQIREREHHEAVREWNAEKKRADETAAALTRETLRADALVAELAKIRERGVLFAEEHEELKGRLEIAERERRELFKMLAGALTALGRGP
jgi:hypothetical protein